MKHWLKAILIIVVLGLMFVGVGGKGCNPWEKDDDDDDTVIASGSSGVGPFDLIATAVSTSQIDLTWKHNLDLEQEPVGTGFELQRKIGAEGTYQTIDTLGLVTSYEDTSLDPDTTYYYRVSAYHTVGGSKVQFSNWSNDAWATTQTWTPTTLTDAPSARQDHASVWTGGKMIIWGGTDGNTDFTNGAVYYPLTDTWEAMTLLSPPSGRIEYTVVWTGEEMLIWGGRTNVGPITLLNTGARYNPSLNQWTPITTTDAPSARSSHTAVWTGAEMLIWGGWDGTDLNDGAKYNPALDTWTPITTTGAPNGRCYLEAVWTGTEMIIWDGVGDGALIPRGAKYNPATDTWAPMSDTDAPEERFEHSAVWAGEEMIIWGGYSNNSDDDLNNGGRYNPVSDTWTAMTTVNAPQARESAPAIWTGTEMIVWGGWYDDGTQYAKASNGGGSYNPATDTWTTIEVTGAPEPRGALSAVWTGSEIIIWGGYDNTKCLNTGGRYKP